MKKNTSLHLAVINNNKKVLKFLCSIEGIDFDIENNEGKTPLDIAKESEKDELTDLLINGSMPQPSLNDE